MKGIVTFYLNFQPEHTTEDIQRIIQLFWQTNKETIDKVISEVGYQVMVVPAFKESCRVEKVDFDKPHPRLISKYQFDIAEVEDNMED